MTKKTSVLITGNAGFIGSHIADKFVKNNFTVIGIDNFKTGRKENINKKVIHYNEDLLNIKGVKRILKKHKPEYVIHHASNLVGVELSVKNPVEAYTDIVITSGLVDSSKDLGVKHIVFASSANVYGNPKKFPIKESTPANPLSPYGLTKFAIENFMQYVSSQYKIRTTILRYFNVYGPRQTVKANAAIPTFIKKIKDDKSVDIYGGKQTRDYVNVNDVAEANLLAILKKSSGIFNIGSGQEISIQELVMIIAGLMDKKPKISLQKKSPTDSQKSLASIAKSRTVLGWKPKISIKDGLQEVIKSLE